MLVLGSNRKLHELALQHLSSYLSHIAKRLAGVVLLPKQQEKYCKQKRNLKVKKALTKRNEN